MNFDAVSLLFQLTVFKYSATDYKAGNISNKYCLDVWCRNYITGNKMWLE